MSRLVSVLESVISKLARYDEGSILGSILSFTVTIEHSFCFVSSFQPNAHLLFLPPFYHHLALVSSAENTFSCFSSFIFTSTFIAGKMFKLGYGFLFLSEHYLKLIIYHQTHFLLLLFLLLTGTLLRLLFWSLLLFFLGLCKTLSGTE